MSVGTRECSILEAWFCRVCHARVSDAVFPNSPMYIVYQYLIFKGTVCVRH